MKIKKIFSELFILILCFIFTSCDYNEENLNEEYKETYKVSMIAAGDNLIHDCVVYGGYQKDGTYNYDQIFENIKYKINEYDLAVINQETILVKSPLDYSGYPKFGTPLSMANAIFNAGFDIVLHATNHTRDRGVECIKETLSYWKENFSNIKILGIHESQEDYDDIDYIEKNNIKIAMFNATYGLNGFTLKSNEKYLVNLLDDKDKLLNDIKTSSENSDIQIAFLHIGTEYVYEPTEFQVNYVNDVIDAGCDIVVCSHPHVIEPYGMITTPNGNTALVYYSCGNFMGHQDKIDRFLGGLAAFTIEKEITYEKESNEIISSDIKISTYDFIPIVIHTRGNLHTTYLLEDYTDELAKEHSLRYMGDKFSVKALWQLWRSIIKDYKLSESNTIKASYFKSPKIYVRELNKYKY